MSSFTDHDTIAETIEDVLQLPLGHPPKAGFTQAVAEANGVRILADTTGKVLKAYYPTPVNNPRSFKVRDYTRLAQPSRGFGTIGERKESDYYGMGTLNPGQAKRLIVVEGETDRLALLELFKRFDISPMPDVISVPVCQAEAVAGTHRETFLKYSKVFLGFDSGSAERRLKYEPDYVKRGHEGGKDFFASYAGDNVQFIEWPEDCDTDEDGKIDPRDWARHIHAEYGHDLEGGRIAVWSLLKESVTYKSPEIYGLEDILVEQLKPTLDKPGVILPGLEAISEAIGGWARPNLGIVTAPVGVGKTTFLMETAVGLVRAGKRVGLITLEDDQQSATHHLVARMNNVHPGRYIQDPSLITEEQIIATQVEVKDKLFLVTGDRNHGRMTLDGMLTIILELATVHKCDVIIYDNLSYVSQGGTQDQRMELERSMFALAQISKDHQAQVVVVVQMNRNATVEARPQATPYLFPVRKESLKGSGAIEGAATWIIACCPEINPDGDKGRVGLFCDKFRRVGKLGLASLVSMDEDTGALVDTTDQAPYRWPWEDQDLTAPSNEAEMLKALQQQWDDGSQ